MTMSEQAIDEIRDVFAKIDDSAVDAAVAMIADANKVVVFGGGREGLQIRCLRAPAEERRRGRRSDLRSRDPAFDAVRSFAFLGEPGGPDASPSPRNAGGATHASFECGARTFG